MDIFNKKYINLPVTLGGLIWVEEDDLYNIIDKNMEFGSTYHFIVTFKGNALTKDGMPFDFVTHTLPNSYTRGSSNYEDVTSICMLFNLQSDLSWMVRKSDLIKEIYAEKDLDSNNHSIPKSVFENYELNLQLAYLKSGI